jgi:4-hydroxybenzoate polyprenyltransferase
VPAVPAPAPVEAPPPDTASARVSTGRKARPPRVAPERAPELAPIAAPAPAVVVEAVPPAVPTSTLGRALLAMRVVHPFPSLLDGLVVAVVAVAAGGSIPLAATLGASMTLLQFAIGTLNDAVDAPRDRGVRRGKPIVAGLLTERTARSLATLFAGGGLVLAVAGGPVLLGLAALVLGIGAWYDLAAKGTRFSWLPLAVGVPILPVYGWYGATGTLPASFGVLVPAAALAGAALAIANAAVDIEHDRATGVASLAVALGPVGAGVAALGTQIGVAVLALGAAVQLGASGTWLTVTGLVALIPMVGAAFGVLVARRGPGGREVAFEVQAVGLALLAVAWINAIGVGRP